MEGQQGHPPVIVRDPSVTARVDSTMPVESEYTAPAIYYVWVAEVAACEGLPFPLDKFRKVQWFQVNADVFSIPKIGVVYGASFATAYNGQVFVVNRYMWNRELVRHEAMHLLLYWAGVPNWDEHDPQYYTHCGLVIRGRPPRNDSTN